MSDKKALSVKNPTSYLICLGMKTVENRTWKTDYRGRVYIHSSGDEEFASLADYAYPDRLAMYIDELEQLEGIADEATPDEIKIELQKRNLYEKFEETLAFLEEFEKYQNMLCKHYDGYDIYAESFDDEYEKSCKEVISYKGCFHKNMAIIGHVDLVDIVQDSRSIWAEAGCYHWILENPVLYNSPLINVKGALRLFDVSHII